MSGDDIYMTNDVIKCKDEKNLVLLRFHFIKRHQLKYLHTSSKSSLKKLEIIFGNHHRAIITINK